MRKGASFAGAGAALLCLALLAGCSENDGQSQAPLARIDAVTAKVLDFAPRVTLTGTIQAQVQNDLSFRLSGRIIERNVDIDHVTADQVLARLDPRPQEADVEAAKAGVPHFARCARATNRRSARHAAALQRPSPQNTRPTAATAKRTRLSFQ